MRGQGLLDISGYVFEVMWLCHLYNWSVERLYFFFFLYSICQCTSLSAIGNRSVWSLEGETGIHRLCPGSGNIHLVCPLHSYKVNG